MLQPAGERLPGICLALPEAAEVDAWRNPTYRVCSKIVAVERHGGGPDWQEVSAIVLRSNRLIAPKRLSAPVGERVEPCPL